MKSIVLDGERIAEAIKKTRDNLINVEYDNNDLILRGDALKAIRQRCIGEHLPFKSNTPEGERVLDALVAVHQVKPYKDVCGKWISVKDRLPEKDEYVLCFCNIGDGFQAIFHFTKERKFNGTAVTHWMPLPKPPEVNTDV